MKRIGAIVCLAAPNCNNDSFCLLWRTVTKSGEKLSAGRTDEYHQGQHVCKAVVQQRYGRKGYGENKQGLLFPLLIQRERKFQSRFITTIQRTRNRSWYWRIRPRSTPPRISWTIPSIR